MKDENGATDSSRDATHRASSDDIASMLCGWFVICTIALCCVLPLLWIIWQIALNPTTLHELQFDSFRVWLLIRTVLFNGIVGIVATLLALPAAWVIGRSRGLLAAALWFVLPISLLMPSLVLAYGWKQFLRLLNLDFEP